MNMLYLHIYGMCMSGGLHEMYQLQPSNTYVGIHIYVHACQSTCWSVGCSWGVIVGNGSTFYPARFIELMLVSWISHQGDVPQCVLDIQ